MMPFSRLIQLIRADLYRYEARVSLLLMIKHLVMNNGFIATCWYRVTRYLFVNNYTLLLIPCKLFYRFAQYFFGFEISYHDDIGPGISFVHVVGTFLSEEIQIGRNLNLCHNVTIGSMPRGPKKGYPVIGDNVFIGPGAKIIGRVNIGNNVAIGANAVVTSDLPDNAVAVGIPARIISYEGSEGYILNTDYSYDS